MPLLLLLIFFIAVEENRSVKFSISIVTTHGKLYGKWSRIENCFEKEFNQVWAKVIALFQFLKCRHNSKLMIILRIWN
jgi:hypothetical protein